MGKSDEVLSYAAALCSASEQCAMDILRKVERFGLTSEEKGHLINTLKKNGFLDDERYVRAFINDRFKISRWGKVKIAYMLRNKGLDTSLIENGISLIDQDEYTETLSELLIQKLRNTRSKNLSDLRNKLFRFAISRGFETSVTINCLKKLNPYQDDEAYDD